MLTRCKNCRLLPVVLNAVFSCSCYRLSFYGMQLLEQLQCYLTVRPCCLLAVLLVVTAYFGQINDENKTLINELIIICSEQTCKECALIQVQ